ncbi:MAG: hypothetical protein P1U40_00035 [Coxiellaceae bacterium]|nr:hypothetical protein [Coxiellaceae bacterium]
MNRIFATLCIGFVLPATILASTTNTAASWLPVSIDSNGNISTYQPVKTLTVDPTSFQLGNSITIAKLHYNTISSAVSDKKIDNENASAWLAVVYGLYSNSPSITTAAGYAVSLARFVNNQWTTSQKLLCANTSAAPVDPDLTNCLGGANMIFHSITNAKLYQTKNIGYQTAILQVEGSAYINLKLDKAIVTQLFALNTNSNKKEITATSIGSFYSGSTASTNKLAGVACGNEFCLIAQTMNGQSNLHPLFFTINNSTIPQYPFPTDQNSPKTTSPTHFFGLQYDAYSKSFITLTGSQNSSGTWKLRVSSLIINTSSNGTTNIAINPQPQKLLDKNFNNQLTDVSISTTKLAPQQAFQLYVAPFTTLPGSANGTTPYLFLRIDNKIYNSKGECITIDSPQQFSNPSTVVARFQSLINIDQQFINTKQPNTTQSTDIGSYVTSQFSMISNKAAANKLLPSQSQIQISNTGTLYALKNNVIYHYDPTSQTWINYTTTYPFNQLYPLTSYGLQGNLLLIGNNQIQLMNSNGKLMGEPTPITGLTPGTQVIQNQNHPLSLVPQKLFFIGGTASADK